jgi:hypothetical protein
MIPDGGITQTSGGRSGRLHRGVDDDVVAVVVRSRVVVARTGDQPQLWPGRVRVHAGGGERVLRVLGDFGDDEARPVPSARMTTISSSGFSVWRWRNTPSTPFQVRCPASTAGPISPGVGLSANHPTGAGPVGTCIVPSGSRPRSTVCSDTPSAGISTWTGLLDGKPAGADGASDGETLGTAGMVVAVPAGMVVDGPEGSPGTLGPVPAPMSSSLAPAHPARHSAGASTNGISHRVLTGERSADGTAPCRSPTARRYRRSPRTDAPVDRRRLCCLCP